MLLEAILRMRPDRLYLGEIRGAEAFTFLQGVNTGHPGSCATLHADHPYGAYQRIGMAALQAGMNMSHSELVVFAREVVPIVFQVNRRPNGMRRMTEIYFSKLVRA